MAASSSKEVTMTVTGATSRGVARGLVAAAAVVEVGEGVAVDDVEVGGALGGEVHRALTVGTLAEGGVGGGDEEDVRAANQVGLFVGDVVEEGSHHEESAALRCAARG